jgi:apolipoprotein N-acyltransferase
MTLPERVTVPVAVGLSGVLLFFGSGLHPAWPLTWVAVLPVLLVCLRSSARRAFLVAAIAWLAGEANMWRYLTGLAPAPLVAGFLVVPAIMFGLAVLLFRAFARRGAPFRAMLALPATWVAYEHVNTLASPHGTFGSLAYTQLDDLPVLQIAAITGIAGIVFLLLLAPAAAALAWGEGGRGHRPGLVAAAAGAILAVVVYGGWRLSSPRGSSRVTVALMASDLPRNVNPVEAADTARLLAEYAAHLDQLSAKEARVIVLPEKLGVVVDGQTGTADELLEAASVRVGATLVAGVVRRVGSRRFNEARVYATGRLVGAYDKQHMLPPLGSDLTPGASRTVMSRPSGAWGVAICKDMDFPTPSRGYGADGVGLLLVPAWDFSEDGWLHSRMAVTRGVEYGFAVARAAKSGRLTVSDDRGRILGEASSAAAPFASLVATVPVGHGRTLYARRGDWFAWADVGLLAILLASLGIRADVLSGQPSSTRS